MSWRKSFGFRFFKRTRVKTTSSKILSKHTAELEYLIPEEADVNFTLDDLNLMVNKAIKAMRAVPPDGVVVTRLRDVETGELTPKCRSDKFYKGSQQYEPKQAGVE